MPISSDKIYAYHVANLRQIQVAADHVATLARRAIATRNPHGTLRSLLRLFAFLLGAWAECRLRKLLYEPSGFSDAEREWITSKGTQLEQWLAAVEAAFRKKYSVARAALNDSTIGFTPSSRYTAICRMLDEDLRLIIEVRNKLAHGQWEYPFASDGQSIESEKYQLLNKENLLSLQFKRSLIEHLAYAIHDLVVSKATFERDFDDHYKKIAQTRINLTTRQYAKYESSLIANRDKGLAKRPS